MDGLQVAETLDYVVRNGAQRKYRGKNKRLLVFSSVLPLGSEGKCLSAIYY